LKRSRVEGLKREESGSQEARKDLSGRKESAKKLKG
jgi:hypothetical protein